MGIFSGLMANRLVPEMAQLASRIAAGPAPDPLGPADGKARRQRRAGEVRTFDNIARVRYPRELANALAAYREEAGQ